LSIVLLLSFGGGDEAGLSPHVAGHGEDIGVLWPGATTKAYGRAALRPTLQFTDEDAEILGARIPEIASVSREYNKRATRHPGSKSVNARVRGVDPPSGPCGT
jgi:hypothetical protein